VDAKLRLGWPNRITIARLLLIWPFALCLLYLNEPDYEWLRRVAVGVFALMAFSDALDGYLARRLRDESPLGRFLDPMADKLLITVAVLMLCVKGIHDISDATPGSVMRLPGWVAVIAVGKDVVVSIGFTTVYFATGRVFIKSRFLGKSCTVVQLFLVLSMLLWPDLPVWLSGLPKVLWYVATALAVAATFDYVRLGTAYVVAVAAENRRGQPTEGDKIDADGQR